MIPWHELYPQDKQPDDGAISAYINNGLWEMFHSFIQETYKVEPVHTYSVCSGQPGWNVKYKKSSKALCTLYPMDGFFIALVVIGNKEMHDADLLIPVCSNYIQDLYASAALYNGTKWLMIHVTDPAVLEDTKNLIQLRVKPKIKNN